MQSSPAKRRRELPQRTRSRKKRKRLDAICDEPTASYLADRKLADDEVTFLRRSSRTRHPPDLLDSSPVPSIRMNSLNDLHTPVGRGGGKKGKWKGDDKEEARGSNGLKKRESVAQMNRLLGEEGKWESSLRTRVGKCRGNSSSSFRKSDEGFRELRPWFPVMGDKNIGGGTSSSRSSSRQKKVSIHDVSETATETENKDEILSLIEINCNNGLLAEKSSQVDVAGVTAIEQLESESARVLDRLEKVVGVTEEIGFVNASFQVTIAEESGLLQSRVVEEHGSEDHEPNQSEKPLESPDTNTVLKLGVLKDNIPETEQSLKDNDHRVSVSNEKIAGFRIKEGRRCGLCGCGTDGKPPKMLVHESFDSENEAYEGSTASEEPNYNVWDGFGGEPGWLGRLLGPMNDRFGIARVWVHQHCAVWSPEGYGLLLKHPMQFSLLC